MKLVPLKATVVDIMDKIGCEYFQLVNPEFVVAIIYPIVVLLNALSTKSEVPQLYKVSRAVVLSELSTA